MLTANNVNKYLQDIKQKAQTGSFDSRKSWLSKLTQVPHRDKSSHVIEIALGMLKNESVGIHERRSLLTDAKIGLNLEELISCHIFISYNFVNYPIDRVDSIKFVLNNANPNLYDRAYMINTLTMISRNTTHEHARNDAFQFIKQHNLVETKTNSVIVKTESQETKNKLIQLEKKITNSIGNHTEAKKFTRLKRSIYNDNQNVHDHNINDNIKQTLLQLSGEKLQDRNAQLQAMNTISMRVSELSKIDPNRQRIQTSLFRFFTDTTQFSAGMTLLDVIYIVWKRIEKSQYKEELEKRLIEELNEMSGLCSTGFLSRTLNILSGW